MENEDENFRKAFEELNKLLSERAGVGFVIFYLISFFLFIYGLITKD